MSVSRILHNKSSNNFTKFVCQTIHIIIFFSCNNAKTFFHPKNREHLLNLIKFRIAQLEETNDELDEEEFKKQAKDKKEHVIIDIEATFNNIKPTN